MPILNTLSGGSARSFGGVGGASIPPPTNTVAPALSGSQNVGGTLSCTTGSWTSDFTITYAYQWYNSVSGAIGGATSSSYTLQASDEGDVIKCTVTATAGGVTSATADSNNSSAIGPEPGEYEQSSAGTYSWTAPAGITQVLLEAIGGGGAGSNGQTVSGSFCSGGAAGGYLKAVVPVSGGTTYTLRVGSGGSDGSMNSGETSGFTSHPAGGEAVAGAGAGGGTVTRYNKNFNRPTTATYTLTVPGATLTTWNLGGDGNRGSDNGGAPGGGAGSVGGAGNNGIGGDYSGGWNQPNQNGGTSGSGTAGGSADYGFDTQCHGRNGSMFNGGGGGAASYDYGGYGGTAGGGGASAGYDTQGGGGGAGRVKVSWPV